jgi:2-desacetyl-2-hydroxyethyl bacteriochlorophyllide A dehydrogenase
MRAAVMRGKKIVADTVPDPVPGPGQVLVRTLACGICGSDLHALQHADRMVAMAKESAGGVAGASIMDPSRDVVMGHEFCAEILDFGPSTLRQLKVGQRVCSMPLAFDARGIQAVGYSNDYPGGYGERMVLTEPLLLPVPDGLSAQHAALTEPMAVGVHAVAKGKPEKQDAALVVGCGPVGLAVISALKLAGIGPVVAADFSPRRRGLAEELGADVVVDPAKENAAHAWSKAAGAKVPLFFECVGVPGIINDLMRDAPRGARIVVAGACMEPDRFQPMYGINKELSLQFVLGYTPEEFAGALRDLAEGRIPAEKLVTGRTGIDGVADAFETLRDPEAHAKILVEPGAA